MPAASEIGSATDLLLPVARTSSPGAEGGTKKPPAISLENVKGASAAATGGGAASGGAEAHAAMDLDQPLATRRSPRNVPRRTASALTSSEADAQGNKQLVCRWRPFLWRHCVCRGVYHGMHCGMHCGMCVVRWCSCDLLAVDARVLVWQEWHCLVVGHVSCFFFF